ncbi:hypothetical protein ACPOL_5633 [Acidisarcina polymorpha]|uniref:Uncharacterized protein n=1 Tax=Acidisarcina polymorpha TaxID=2211140 RepID=A0A2Z5G722_9BACT|nr:hypothetical protein ACPOL_5633 [Acidisarcina polymorpha]
MKQQFARVCLSGGVLLRLNDIRPRAMKECHACSPRED